MLKAWPGVGVILLMVAGSLCFQDVAAAETRIVNVPYTCGGKAAELDVTLEAPKTAPPGATVTVVWSLGGGLANAGDKTAAQGTEIGSYGRLRLNGAIQGELAPMTGRSPLLTSVDPGQPIAVPPMTGYMTIPGDLPAGSSVTLMPGDFQLEVPGAGKTTCVTEVTAGTQLLVAAATSPSPSPSPSATPTPSATPSPSASPSPSATPSPTPTTTVTVSMTASPSPQVLLTPLGGAATGAESSIGGRALLGLFLIVFGSAGAALIGRLIWRRA
ncbi:hypothetical protein GCM10009555_034730 [Acrocarpospora macrocephala]|uniref:Uncharacterized protein n=1 Tax=Acrocarpospora macrocephala TaxID=150177 RepID=A0A5M3WCK5_9ACTN|nr:hypothetical protein [Acrocarpospora macrocephala]GES06654.1 hypothetical protein Amac_002490 [Acrocarpospora macrocephala]